MKHYHNKRDLGDNDVKYIIVATGDQFQLNFKHVDTQHNDTSLFQGVKFWLNRCKLIIDNDVVPTDRVIVWYAQEKKKARVAGRHFHYYTDKGLTFQVIETIDEKPNLGIFNVWTADNKRCYEFSGNSYIREIKKGDQTYQAGHGWATDNNPTIEFDIEKI